jgi:hypothetical protein
MAFPAASGMRADARNVRDLKEDLRDILEIANV